MRTHRLIHHTADTQKEPQFEKVRAYHDSGARGKWPAGFGIQYHRFIERDGFLIECHPYDKTTWHAGSTEWNLKSAGWCLAGDFTKETPTDAQLDTLFILWKNEGFPLLERHGNVRQTSCPGVFDFIGALNDRYYLDLQQRLKNAITSIPRVSGARLKSLVRFIERVKKVLSSPHTPV